MTMELPPTGQAPVGPGPAAGPAPVAPAPAGPAPAPAPLSPAAAVVRPRRTSSRVLDVALIGAAALAIGGVAFGIGRATAPAVPAAFRDGVAFQGGNGVPPNGSFDPGAGPRGGLGFAGGF